jgi:hypothetical protein
MARKVHYSCDAFFAISWGLITGFNSPYPWFYPFFFCCMIAHRATRDIQRCRATYGKAWEQYEKQVPYLFIPVCLSIFKFWDFTNLNSMSFRYSSVCCRKRGLNLHWTYILVSFDFALLDIIFSFTLCTLLLLLCYRVVHK